MRRVVISGLGLVTPLAVGHQNVWRRLIAGDSGVDVIRSFDASHFPAKIAAEVPIVSSSSSSSSASAMPLAEADRRHALDPAQVLQVSTQEAEKMPKFILFAIAAAEEALSDAQWRPDTDVMSNSTGVSIGVGMSSLTDIIEANRAIESSPMGYRRVSPFFVPRILPNLAAGNVAIKNRLRGPTLCPATACAAGAHAIGDAFRLIRNGDADVMLAGGSESCINAVAFVGFLRARALSTHFNDTPQRASRPFDTQRDGFVIGEGCGLMVLEELEHARRRGAKIYAEMTGYGMSGDGHHITAPAPDGQGARRAMEGALRDGHLRPEQVDYVNAHATSTPLGDRIENNAIQNLLRKSVLVSSTKGAVGHLLGASGAVEAAFTVLALSEQVVPATLNLDKVEDDFELDYVAKKSRASVGIQHALSNSFGFGGTNASLLFKTFAS